MGRMGSCVVAGANFHGHAGKQGWPLSGSALCGVCGLLEGRVGSA